MKKIKRLLIANRGEIACRVIRTAQALGIYCISIYSSCDRFAKHVQLADEAHCIGRASATSSYLCGDKIIALAKTCDVDAIHPGYGFLSENAAFAKAAEQANIIFIGPPATAITAMGSKSAAKQLMQNAKVPLVPGYHGSNQDPTWLQQEANKIGYPVLLKASKGGGGKGMRIVNHENEFKEALASAKREAKASFADDHILIEKYLLQPRHIEIQVFCDTHGQAVYLFERDCSIQRRHQKIIEEAPAFNLSDTIRQQMGEAAIRAAQAIDYVGAGTVEFLYSADQTFYFMEMNTRLQVEHPVTEMITHCDLVAWQILVAEGEPLPKTQAELKVEGHAIEARIYAEDPNQQFLPQTGTIHYLSLPATNADVRIDAGIIPGTDVTHYYDPMLAKLIVHGSTREQARQRLAKALSAFHLVGVNTNIAFLQKVIALDDFKTMNITTQFIDKNQTALFEDIACPDVILAFAAVYMCQHTPTTIANDTLNPWQEKNQWQSLLSPSCQFKFDQGDHQYTIDVTRHADADYSFNINDTNYRVRYRYTDKQYHLILADQSYQAELIYLNDTLHIFHESHYALKPILLGAAHTEKDDPQSKLTAPMPGTITAVLVTPAQAVKQGTPLLVIEAMKMEHTITAPRDGTVISLPFKTGDLVNEGIQLVEFELS